MEFKENKNNYYTKELNKLDRYLLRIVKRYFDLEEINNAASINAIITEAIMRYKASIIYEQSLVATLNNKFGIVNININDLNGEKVFEKLTAFNKDFGNAKDTICMGNDERLSDKRKPTEHHHKISDVLLLEEELNKIKKELSKYSFHLHDNIDILNKLKYTGTNTQIDLIKLESFGSIVNMLLNTLEIKRNELIELYDSNESIINDLINQIYLFMQRLYNYIEDADNYINKLLIRYIKEKEDELDSIKENISTKYSSIDDLNKISNVINNTMLLINTQEYNITEMFTTNNAISDNIQSEQDIDFSAIPVDCITDSIEIVSELVYNNTRVKIPYITEDFVISTGISNSNKLYTKIQPLKPNITLPTEIYNGKIMYNIYSNRKII